MPRKNKRYFKKLHDLAYIRFTSMISFGESKYEAKKNGSITDKVYAISTYKTYWWNIKHYLSYLKDNHPDCTTLKKARTYVPEWLEARERQGLSAWTIQTEAKALGKLFGIRPTDSDYYNPPKRLRANIKRSRRPVISDRCFSETKNKEFVQFCKHTGLRRSEIRKLRGKDLRSREQIIIELSEALSGSLHARALEDALLFENEYFLYVVGKGGRERYSPIIGENVDEIVARIKATPPENKVWPHVHTNADIHSYRSEYATIIYKKYAVDIDLIPKDKMNKGTGKMYQSGVYFCRKDERGKKLDKKAMRLASAALGHHRLEIVANNYIRGL